MPSFDIVSKIDHAEMGNAIQGMEREITTRYDFKGSKSTVELSETSVTLLGDDDVKLRQLQELLRTYVTRRGLEADCLEFGKSEDAAGAMVRQIVTIKEGIDRDLGKKIVKEIKNAKMKVQTAIQGDELRVTGKKRDDLQAAMQLIREMNKDRPVQFVNFRD